MFAVLYTAIQRLVTDFSIPQLLSSPFSSSWLTKGSILYNFITIQSTFIDLRLLKVLKMKCEEKEIRAFKSFSGFRIEPNLSRVLNVIKISSWKSKSVEKFAKSILRSVFTSFILRTCVFLNVVADNSSFFFTTWHVGRKGKGWK